MATAQRISTLAGEIRAYCNANADPTLATRYARYFKEGYDAWGMLSDKHPFFNEKQAEWLEQYRDLKLDGFLKLGETLFASGKYEEGAIAIRFVKSFGSAVDGKTAPKLAKWFAAGIGNWAHTDVLCGGVIEPALADGRIPLSALAAWRESTWKYQRRAVPVAMLGLVKAGKDAAPLLDFLRPLMEDGERVVQQGLGWFLREAWKKQPEPVEEFLLEWKERAPRLIFQYATEKMTPAAKARFKRARAASRR